MSTVYCVLNTSSITTLSSVYFCNPCVQGQMVVFGQYGVTLFTMLMFFYPGHRSFVQHDEELVISCKSSSNCDLKAACLVSPSQNVRKIVKGQVEIASFDKLTKKTVILFKDVCLEQQFYLCVNETVGQLMRLAVMDTVYVHVLAHLRTHNI